MKSKDDIRAVENCIVKNRIDIPDKPGLYAFWWIGNKEELLNANRELRLKGPKGETAHVEYSDWWPNDLEFPCLYVGKTTNLKQRFGQHLLRGTKFRCHQPQPNNFKAKPHTTSCQVRWGVEHIFPNESEPLKLICKKVGYSYDASDKMKCFAQRFFDEDLYIGTWHPWFNIDTER